MINTTYNTQTPIIGILRETDDATLPTRAHDGDACYDLYSAEDCYIHPIKDSFLHVSPSKLVSTGLIMSIPDGWAGFIHDRSSMGLKGIRTLGGVIDSTYRGLVKIILANLGTLPFQIRKGDRIAQIEFRPIHNVQFQEGEPLSETVRSTGGFGSTGT